jgi:hypothetical protein
MIPDDSSLNSKEELAAMRWRTASGGLTGIWFFTG